MKHPQATKDRVAALLARGLNQSEAAAEVGGGLNSRTIRSWLSDDAYRGKVDRLRGEELAKEPSATGVLEDALTALKKDGSPDHSIRVSAARAILAAAAGAAKKREEEPTPAREATINHDALRPE